MRGAAAEVRQTAIPAVQTDAEIIAQVLDGDREAFGVLVRRYQQMLYRHLQGMGIDHDTSLDLVQDAFVKAYTRLRECRDAAHFRAWLLRICRNRCLDHLKNVRRRSVSLSTLPNAARIPSDHAEREQLARRLREALNALPPLLREAFLLKHDAGYEYDQIAAIVEASPSAVKMRVHRARQILRVLLSEGREPVAR